MFVSEETVCVFWVSSLAYPNSLGTKGFVVVVVVSEETVQPFV